MTAVTASDGGRAAFYDDDEGEDERDRVGLACSSSDIDPLSRLRARRRTPSPPAGDAALL